MDLARHCLLCDNQIFSIKEGTTCKLTNESPDFNTTCATIELNEKFEERIKRINIAYQNVLFTKTDTFGHVTIFSIIRLAVLFSGYYLGEYAWDNGVISTVPLMIIAIGLGVLVFAFGPLNKYRNELSIAKSNKDKLDEVLRLYNIDYTIDLKYGDKIHGIIEVQADLKVNKNC